MTPLRLRPFNSLYARLAAVLLGLLSVVGVGALALTAFTTTRYVQETHQKLGYRLAGELVAHDLADRDQPIDGEALRSIFDRLMVINPSIELYLLDADGTILAYSAPEGKVQRKRVALAPITRFLSGREPLPIVGDDPRDPRRQKVFSVAPIPPNPASGAPLRYLYVVLGGEAYESIAAALRGSYLLRLVLGIGAASFVVAVLAGLLLFRVFTRPLRRVASTMERVSQETPPRSTDAAEEGGDEVAHIQIAFDRMAARIRDQVERLTHVDRLRRELVANVSHDLRTPLASLHGYLETLLLKSGTLTATEQRAYLETAVAHSARLGKLVAELFELATLDSQEVQLRVETFSLGELAQDVAQKVRLAAERQHIAFDVRETDVPFVSAEIGLIERVFENLFENALRYTTEGGTIAVALRRLGNRIEVRVIDTGCGIAEGDLPHVADRFYRGAQASTARSAGSGLGLAIVKRIVELHGGALAITSTVGSGTTVTFDLPVGPAVR